MKTKIGYTGSPLVGLFAILAVFGSADSARGAFVGPYSLTPPAAANHSYPGDGATYGGWTVTTDLAVVPFTFRAIDTRFAPDTLSLQVGDIDFSTGPMGADMTFTTHIVDTGTLSFDFTVGYGGGGPNTLEFLHNGSLVGIINPPSGSFSHPVVPGDLFGFRLTADYGLYASQVVVNVSNFNVPEPSAGMLLLGAGLVLVRRRR